ERRTLAVIPRVTEEQVTLAGRSVGHADNLLAYGVKGLILADRIGDRGSPATTRRTRASAAAASAATTARSARRSAEAWVLLRRSRGDRLGDRRGRVGRALVVRIPIPAVSAVASSMNGAVCATAASVSKNRSGALCHEP